jgi:hypothetical protein
VTDGTTTGDDAMDNEDEFEFVPAEEADAGMVKGGDGSLKVGAYPVDRDGERLWRRVRRG